MSNTQNLKQRVAPLLLAALLSASILGALAPASAQLPVVPVVVGSFGSQVHPGDYDYTPVAKKDAIAVTANMVIGDDSDTTAQECIVIDTTATPGIQLSDLHLNDCAGRAAGSLVKGDDNLATIPSTPTPIKFTYLDVDGSNSYNKGDWVYASSISAPNLVSGALHSWTVRLTANIGGRAGVEVLPGDADVVIGNGVVKSVTMSLVQRDDKAWYLAPVGAPPAGGAVLRNNPIPVLSIRVTNAANPQPTVIPLSFTVGDPDIVAGEPTSVAVTVQNNGGLAGAGLLVTKLGGQIVDARMTPYVSPTDKATVLVTFAVPATMSGSEQLAVNDVTQVVFVKGAAAPPPAGADLAALQGTVQQLQARLALLEAAPGASAAANPLPAPAAAQTSPSLAPLALVGVLLLGALLVGRRRPGALPQ